MNGAGWGRVSLQRGAVACDWQRAGEGTVCRYSEVVQRPVIGVGWGRDRASQPNWVVGETVTR